MANNERERRMSMLRAALPYTMGTQRHALEMLLQADSLINIARRRGSDLEACDYNGNPEEMLLHIQEYCTPRETDMVQMILNFMKANHLFQNYREFMASYPDRAPADDLQAASYSRAANNPLTSILQLFGGFGGAGNSNLLMEFLLSQLPPEQRQLLEQLQNSNFFQNQGNQPQNETPTQDSEIPLQEPVLNQDFTQSENNLAQEEPYAPVENELAAAEIPLDQ